MVDALAIATGLLDLAKTQGTGIALAFAFVYVWLTGKVISKGNHDAIVQLHMQLTEVANKNTDDAWNAFDAVAPAAERAQSLATKALETHPRRPAR